MCSDGRSTLSKHVCKHIVKFKVGNGQTVLCSVLLSGCVRGKLNPIAAEITELTNIVRWNKASVHEIVLEQIGDPLSILLVSLFALNCLYEFRMANDNITSVLQMLCIGNQYLPVDSIQTSLQLLSKSQAFSIRNSSEYVENLRDWYSVTPWAFVVAIQAITKSL